jgi:hypothetical protein
MKEQLLAALVPPPDPALASRERILREGFFRAAPEGTCVVVVLADERRRRSELRELGQAGLGMTAGF